MRLGFDARIMAIAKAGISTYLINLIKQLSRRADIDIFLFCDKPFSADFEHLNERFRCIFFGQEHRKRWAQFYLPRQLRKNKIELYHATWNDAVPIFAPCPVVASIHDLIPLVLPGYFKSWKKRLKYYLQEYSAAHRAEKILTLSEHSKGDVVRFLKVKPEKVIPVRIGVEDDFKTSPATSELIEFKKQFNLPRDYFLAVGAFDQPRRNVKFLIRSFIEFLKRTASGMNLVVIMHSQPQEVLYEESHQLIGENQLEGRIILTPQFSKEELVKVLYGAYALILPSLYEGFGLPALEAMTAGVPVLVSNSSSIPEVVADAGIYFNPVDEESLIRALVKITKDEKLRTGLITKGRERSRLFSWNEFADCLLGVYREVLTR